MIEGFQIDISTAELDSILRAKADLHGRKAERYEKSVTATQEALDVGEEEEENSYSSNNIMPSVKSKVREHRAKQAYLILLADHLVPNETYRLAHIDLGQLDLTANRY